MNGVTQAGVSITAELAGPILTWHKIQTIFKCFTDQQPKLKFKNMTISYYREPLTQNFMGSFSFAPLVRKMIFAFAKKTFLVIIKDAKATPHTIQMRDQDQGRGKWFTYQVLYNILNSWILTLKCFFWHLLFNFHGYT